MSQPGRRIDVPHLSLAERDRRWGRVRALMARDGLDALVAPANTGSWDALQANARYLTSMGGNGALVSAVVLREGEVTAITGPVPDPTYWRGYQDWVTDIRTSFFSLGDDLVKRLRELGVERGRIGLAGLAGVARYPDGTVAQGTYQKIRDAFPDAELVNATFLMDEARFVKGPEEIAFLAQAVALVERAIEVLRREARPGAPESVVYARMQASMVERGAEPSAMLLWSAGSPQPASNGFIPTLRALQPGDVIATEIEARWGGYIGQVTQPAILGKAPTEYVEMFQVQQEAVRRCYERMRPGATIGELLAIGDEVAQGTPYQCRMILHGRGLGADAPIAVFGARDPRIRDWRLEENAVLIVKPVVTTHTWNGSPGATGGARAAGGAATGAMMPGTGASAAGEAAKSVCWGDCVVVTPSGARRLGALPPELIEIR